MANNSPKANPNYSAVQTRASSHTTSNSNLNSYSLKSSIPLKIVKGISPTTAELESAPANNQAMDRGMEASASVATEKNYIKKEPFIPSRIRPEEPASKAINKTEAQERTARGPAKNTKAEQGAKPKAEQTAKPKAEQTAKPKAEQGTKPKATENKKKSARDKEQEQQSNAPFAFSPTVTDRSKQEVSNQRTSYGLVNYNRSGGGRGGKKPGKPKKPEFGMDRINSIIDSSKKLQQMHQDLSTAVKEGAPPRVLKEKAKQFENQFSKLTKDLDRVGTKFNKLGPESMNVLKQKIGDEKFKQLNGALDGAKQCMSPESLKNIGMEGSKSLNQNMQKFTQSLEKMQSSIQALLKTVNNALSFGR